MNFRTSRDEHSSSLCSRGDRSFCRLRQFMKIACRLSVLAAALFPNQHFYPAFHHGFVQTKKQPKILCVAMLQWPCFLTPCNLDHFEDFFNIQVYLCSSKIIFSLTFHFFRLLFYSFFCAWSIKYELENGVSFPIFCNLFELD